MVATPFGPMQNNTPYDPVGWHGTTILCVRT